jgi:hypothetical protein
MIDLPRPLFSLGRILVTPAAHEAVERAGATIDELVERHVSGDWGDVDVDDANANAEAVSTGARILSAYALPKGGRVWVMTEAIGRNRERRATTVLLPNEY